MGSLLLSPMTRPRIHGTSLPHPSFPVVEPPAALDPGACSCSVGPAHQATLATERKSP
jgi:hypothetical protein